MTLVKDVIHQTPSGEVRASDAAINSLACAQGRQAEKVALAAGESPVAAHATNLIEQTAVKADAHRISSNE